MFDEASEITGVVSDKEGELDLLRKRMADDYDLLVLTAFEPVDPAGNARKGYQSYTSSAPRNFFDKVLDGLNRAQVSVQIKLPDKAPEKARRAASVGEMYLWGALAAIDRRLVRRGEPTLGEGVSFFICLRGWYGLRALVYVPKGKEETVFDVQAWDPLHMTWEQGQDGLLWAAYKRRATKAQIYAEYDVTIEGKEAEVLDFWDTERNSVVIGNAFVKAPTPHGLDHVPVMIGAVGAMPTMQAWSGEGSAQQVGEMLRSRGDSVWAAARGLYAPRNKFISWLMETAARSVSGSLVHKTEHGDTPITSDPYETFKVIPLKWGDELRNLELPPVSVQTAVVQGIIEEDIQQSTLPYPLAYGGTREALSGRALGMLQDNTKSVYSPRAGAKARAYTWLCEELLSQFAAKGLKAQDVVGYKPSGREGGEFFKATVKPTDIDPSWFVTVTVEPRLPRDEEAEIMMAKAATTPSAPGLQSVLSMQTARERVMKLADPDAEGDKVLAEMGETMPPIMATNIAAALKRRGKDELAEQVIMLLKPPQQGPPGAPGMPPVGPETEPGRAPAAEPPAGELPEVLAVVLQALSQGGEAELAQALAQALDQGSPMPPELIAAVVAALERLGAPPEVIQEFLVVVGATPPPEQAIPGQPGPSPPIAPPIA